MLKIYHHPRSTYARRVLIALAEKGIAYDEVVLDMIKREHRTPEYLALNPYGRVPTLVEDGFVLFESAAILRYLEETRPEHPLLPADARGRALVDMHVRLCDIQCARQASVIVFPKRFLKEERWDRAAIAAAQGELARHFEILAAQLGGREYLVADRFTLADLAYIPFLYFLPLLEVELAPNLAAWSARLLARPSLAGNVPDR